MPFAFLLKQNCEDVVNAEKDAFVGLDDYMVIKPFILLISSLKISGKDDC